MAEGFNIAILMLAKTGLDELVQGQQSGKVPCNPSSEAHFFSAWVTRAIKQQRFPHCVAKQLLAWQKAARTQGANAGLKPIFEQICATYQPLVDASSNMAAVSSTQLEQLFAALDEHDWYVERGYPVSRKVTHHTDGKASLVVCSEQWQQSIDANTGTLIKPLSVYARGDVSQLIHVAYQHGLLLHKITDYKSLVKYHGEFIIYPNNAGTILAQLQTPSQG
ncbi:DUF2913 family protein [Ferrimonas lipolytica]|uniref:DUF2913 family protein n=1 Tax=Ferrimonas lipolytica TaxID=2724191 RepID=A0A6H1UDY1_9GAMM|nr:DUF2913 family protein [Ferrimonas lipolytica]QIZ77295.1 DUF2913 family protein [Ferrimonas lipolytica]